MKYLKLTCCPARGLPHDVIVPEDMLAYAQQLRLSPLAGPDAQGINDLINAGAKSVVILRNGASFSCKQTTDEIYSLLAPATVH